MRPSLAMVVGVALARVAAGSETDTTSAFACGARTLGVGLDRQPAVRFARLDDRPLVPKKIAGRYAFSFPAGPVSSVIVDVASDGPDDGIWYRAVNADFELCESSRAARSS